MTDDRPLWRACFDRIERAATPLMEDLFRREEFHGALGLVVGARHDLRRQGERATRKVLHVFNLPAGSDITRVLAELGRLRAELLHLSTVIHRLQEVSDDGRDPGETRGPAGAGQAGRQSLVAVSEERPEGARGNRRDTGRDDAEGRGVELR